MRKLMRSVEVRGLMGRETQEQLSLISTLHNVAITAVRSDSAVRRTLNLENTRAGEVTNLGKHARSWKNNTYVEHIETHYLLLDFVNGESTRLWQRRADVG